MRKKERKEERERERERERVEREGIIEEKTKGKRSEKES